LTAALGLFGSLVTSNAAFLAPVLAISAGVLGAIYLAVERWQPMRSTGGDADRTG
jgi:hypothetical protein